MAPPVLTRSARFRELKMMRGTPELFGTNSISISPIYNNVEAILEVSQNIGNQREYIVLFSVADNRDPIGNTSFPFRTESGDGIANILQLFKNLNNTYYAVIQLTTNSRLLILEIRNNDYRVGYSRIDFPVIKTYDPTRQTDQIVPTPTIYNIFASNNVLQVNFSALTNNGGFSIINYQYSLNGEEYINANVTSSPIIISGLINGTLYSVKIRALTYYGAGKDSNIFTSTPAPVPTSAPTINTILNSNGALQLSFSAPVDDGGSPITSYQYSLNGGSYVNVDFTTYKYVKLPAANSFSIFITGLTNRQLYSVKIRAVNSAGYGGDSNIVTSTPDEIILLP